MGTNRSMKLNDVAKLAGVSRSTVSRVVNDDPRVSPDVRQRVQETIRQVGYRPHATARALASHRSRAIGLVVPEDFARTHVDTWYALIIEACLKVTRDLGLRLILIMQNTSEPGAGMRVAQQFYQVASVDGVLVLQHSYGDELTPGLEERGVPHVLLGESSIPTASWVDNDNWQGGYTAGQHLIEHGAMRPAIVSATHEHIPSASRRNGFIAALAEAGLTLDPSLDIETQHSVEAVKSVAHMLFQQTQRPDGIFAANGWVSPILIQAGQEIGFQAPDDYMILEFDDFESGRNEALGLTAIVQQISVLAEQSVHLLLQLIEKQVASPQRILLQTDLIERGSCREHGQPEVLAATGQRRKGGEVASV
jgi:LacI family transcriptional regulator